MIALLLMAAACLTPHGDRITASDVTPAVPAFARIPEGQVIGYAPLPGVTRTFRAQELRQWLQRHGIAGDTAMDVCFEWPSRSYTSDDIRGAMLASLPPGSDVVLQGGPAGPLPAGTLQFPLAGLSGAVWNGFTEYAPGRRSPVSVRVAVQVPYTRVMTTSAIRAGERITAERLRLETGIGTPPKQDGATTIEQVAGKSAARFLPAGTAVSMTALTEPAAVSRGDTLLVEVRNGNACLRFEGQAQASAASGTLVPIRMRDTGRLIHARASGDGHAVLDLEKP